MDSSKEKDQPLDRAVAVLEAVAKAARPMSVTEIAQDCGLPIPTVHRLSVQLETRRLLKRVPGTRKFVVGSRLLRLGHAALEASLKSDRPHQIVAALANQLGEHCQLGVRIDGSVLYVDTVRVNRSQGLHFEQGRRSPLYCTSIGKLFLAEMPAEEFDWWLRHTELVQLAPNSIVSPDQLQKAIKVVRKTGWATSNEELAAGVVGCAVPVRDEGGRLIAGLGISVPSARVSHGELLAFRPLMEQAAREICAFVSQQG